jgi:Major Facilitator Superfamily
MIEIASDRRSSSETSKPRKYVTTERREALRNAALHVFEGAALIGASAAINANTVGTSMVADLGGPTWAVGLTPVAAVIGFSLGPILSAHRIDGMTRYVPWLRRQLPWQRLLPLLAVLLLWLHGRGPLTLWTVVFMPLVAGTLGGLTIGAWQQLIGNTVSAKDRPSMFGARYLLSNLAGFAVAALVSPILRNFPGTDGYALLQLIACAGGIVGYLLLIRVREPEVAEKPSTPAVSFLDNLRDVPRLFRDDRRLGLYLASAVLFNAQYLFIGFLALRARDLLHAPESYVGALTSAQMAGAVGGTLAAVALGRRFGSRFMLCTGRLILLATSVLALTATTDIAFRIAFAFYGAATFVSLIGHNTMCLLLPPPGKASTVLGVFSVVQIPCMLLFGQVGAWLWGAGVPFAWLALAGGLLNVASFAAAWNLHTPSSSTKTLRAQTAPGETKDRK